MGLRDLDTRDSAEAKFPQETIWLPYLARGLLLFLQTQSRIEQHLESVVLNEAPTSGVANCLQHLNLNHQG